MKKFVIAIVCVLFFSSPLLAQDTMKLVYYNDFAPFSWEDSEKQMHGILIDVVNEVIQKQMGIAVSHQGYQWEKAQEKVRNGEADAFITVPTQQRREYTQISTEPFIVGPVTLFTSKANPKIEFLKKVHKLSDLKQFKLVDYSGNGWAKKSFSGFNVDWYDKVDDVLFQLVKSREDVFVHSSQVANYTIKELGLRNQLIEIPIVLESIDFNLCIGINSQYIGIIEKVDKILREMRADRRLQKLYEKYK